MFSDLSKYRVILVTGPHRSGTTICARMIAADTGHDFVIEDEIGFSNLKLLATYIQADYGPVVIQCPFMSHMIDDLNYTIDLDYGETMVVMMHRYLPDIVRSERKSLVDFKMVGLKTKGHYNDRSDKHPADVKYAAWNIQCENIPHAMDVGYESLRDHPLWMEDRKSLRFEHAIIQTPPPKVFRDGLLAIQNI